MGSVNEEITRINNAKTAIDTAIIQSGGPLGEEGDLIDTYADRIRAIPEAVFKLFTTDQIGDDSTYIKWVKLDNGLIDAAYGGVMGGATTTTDGAIGLVPQPLVADRTKFLRGDGTWVTPTNTDTKVTQINTTTNKDYRVIFSYIDNDTNYTYPVRKSASLTYNPSTKILTTTGTVAATTLQGNLDGSYVSALTNYAIGTAVSDIAATDTLNTALGKLEYKANLGVSAYSWYKSITDEDADNVINKWGEIVDFIDAVNEGTDIIDEFVTRKTEQEITGKKTFTNYLYLDHKDSNGACIFFKNNRLKSGGGGWADDIISHIDFNGNRTSRLGVLGNEDKLTYMYLGTAAYNGLNLRISSNSTSFGNNNLYETYLNINTIGAGGNNFSENYTKPYTNKALVIGPILDGTTALYINRGGILTWNTTSDTPKKDQNGTVAIPDLKILGAGGVTYFGGDVMPINNLTLSLGGSTRRWRYFNGKRIGQSNDSVFITAMFPRYSDEAIREFYKDGYTYTSGTTPSAEQYFKALCRWAINTYADNTTYTDSVITLIGQAAPSITGTLILSLYIKEAPDSTGLPRYCSGEFISIDLYKIYFACNGFQSGTTNSLWTWSIFCETNRGTSAHNAYNTGDRNCPILFSLDSSNKYAVSYFDSEVTINPYRNSVTATSFVGALHSPYSRYAYEAHSLVYLGGQFSKSSTTFPAILGSDATYQKASCPSHLYTSGDLVNIMSLRLVWGPAYWHEIYCDPNNETMWHRNVLNGSAKSWKAILDEKNYTNYFKGLVETYLTSDNPTNLPNSIPATGFYSIHNYEDKDLWDDLFPEYNYGRVLQFGGNGYGTGQLAWTYNHKNGYSTTGNLYWRSGDPGRNTEEKNYWKDTSWKQIAFSENCVKSNLFISFTDSSNGVGLLDNARVLALTGGQSLTKSSWSYNGNGYITATKPNNTTKLADLDLAGASVLTFGNTTAYTQLFITAPAQSGHNGITNEILFYLNHGSNYSPGWTRVLTNRNYESIIAGEARIGDSDFSDGTELLTSCASDSGFSDANAVNKLYKRKASSMYNYIKSKLNSVYLSINGTATASKWLDTNDKLEYGAHGLQYFQKYATSAGTTPNENVTPGSGWWHIIRMNHGNTPGYFTDLASSFNGSLYYRHVYDGSNYGWYRIIDSNNYIYSLYKQQLTNIGPLTSGAWYRCATLATKNDSCNLNTIISLQRNFNSPLNEHYIFSISVGYNGQVNISQLSGCTGGHLITKVRVIYTNSSTCYFDFYVNPCTYANSYKVLILAGDCVSTQVPTVTTATGGVEVATVNGMSSNYGFKGNADSATLLKSSGKMTSNFLTGSTKFSDTGLSLVEAHQNYVTNGPANFGNVLLIKGKDVAGCGELFLEWTISTTPGNLYYRSLRDVAGTNWSLWTTLLSNYNYNNLLPVKLVNGLGYSDMIASGYLRSDYVSAGYPAEDYLKALCLLLINSYKGCVCIGSVRPSTGGSYICYVYDTTINTTTGLPEYMVGTAFLFNGMQISFGTVTGAWYYRIALNSINYTNYTLNKFQSMCFTKAADGYVNASFLTDELKLAAADTYIEFWDPRPDGNKNLTGWFNSKWGKVIAVNGFEGNLTGNAASSNYIRTQYTNSSEFYDGYKVWFKWLDTTTLGLKIGDVNNNATSIYKFRADLAGAIYLSNSNGGGNFPLIFTNTAVAGTPQYNNLYTASTNTLYYNPLNTLLTVPKISLATTGGFWISGKSHTSPAINISTKQTSQAYHPILNVETCNGHFVSLGGIDDLFGFYGYHASLTDNDTTWRTYWDVGTGRFTNAGDIYGRGFYQTSDATLKIFKDDVKVDFDKLKSIPKKYFYWKSDDMCTLLIGTSAQEVLKLYPELVSSNDGILSVAYDKLSILALKSIDELYEMIINLKSENEELRNKINALNNL